MNEDTIRDIYYVEHKWNPHFFYLSPKSFCQDLEKNGSDLYLDLFHAMYQEESDYICPYTENDFSLRKELCNNGTTIIYQLITPSPTRLPITANIPKPIQINIMTPCILLPSSHIICITVCCLFIYSGGGFFSS